MKAQSALEYLMIIAITLIIIVPTTYLFSTYSRHSAEQIIYSQINDIGINIINNANFIYQSGEYSKIVMDINMPEKINDVYILYNRELVFNIESEFGSNEMVFFSNANIVSDSCTPEGCSLCERCDLSDIASSGIKKIKIESINQGKQVLIKKEE